MKMTVADNLFDRIQARQNLANPNCSQMSFIEAAATGKPAKAPEVTTAFLESRISTLSKMQDEVRRLNVALSSLFVCDRTKQLRLLKAALAKVDAFPKAGVTQDLNKVRNELVSLREGVFTGAAIDKKTLTLEHCLALQGKLQSKLESARSRLSSLTAKPSDDALDSETEFVLKRNQELSERLKKIAVKKMVITRAPVIPIVKFPLNIAELAAKGIHAENVGGYAIIHNQIVVGVKKSSLLPKQTALDAVNKIIPLIEKQLKRKVNLLSEKPTGFMGGLWFWVMPADKARVFALAFPGRHIKFSSWGFPFNSGIATGDSDDR